MALIRYRNSSEFAVISFKNYKEPILTPEPKCLHPASVQTYGPSDILLISDGSNGSAANTPNDPEYQVLTNSGATPLATIKDVIQRVDRTETGTIFLLTDKGVTVLRCLAAEREYQTEEWQKEGN